MPLFNNLSSIHNFYFTEITRPGCPPSINLDRSDIRSKCSEESKQIFDYIIKNKNVDLIIIHGWWEHYLDKNNLSSLYNNDVLYEIENTVNQLSDFKIIIIAAVPSKSIDPLRNFLRSIFYKEKIYNKFEQDNLYKHLKRTKKSRDFFSYLDKKYQNISVLYPEKYLCNKQKCITIENDKLLYGDTNHLSLHGSTYFKDGLNNLFFELLK